MVLWVWHVCYVQGHIRFAEENGATKGMEGLVAAAGEGEKPKLCGAEVELRILTGTDSKLLSNPMVQLVILPFDPYS